ncbi:hypothetical protein F5878DRAFT_650604 [Lentinula raphanica]|uniref:Integrase core domain-containing protein n=1 Tax=Lentinula raphanica TaxID=153919 RepID=A0AA38PE82_9AGAR|nr:hypothetical protein F5878DRAFT_650604 [Lentinula raphanica]
MARQWSLLFCAFYLLWHIAVRSDFCGANNNTAATTLLSGSVELLHEFRRHYHSFDSIVHQVAHDQTDVFHLRLLLEDMNEFSTLVSQHSNVFPDQAEWQTLCGNLQQMIFDFLRWAYTHRTTTGIAEFLGLSRRTVRRALLEQGLVAPGNDPFQDQDSAQEGHTLEPNLDIPSSFHPEIEDAARSIQSSSSSTRRSNMSNDTLDSFIRLLRTHYPRAGIQMLHGMLRRLGQVVPYENIRRSLIRVDPVHRVFERIKIRRRRYNVPGPNSLWHHDGHHLHNVRIERLWVDVSNYISQHWNNLFTRLEMDHQLDVSNRNHIWLLQHLFLNIINQSLSFWAEAWNCHRISQRHGDGPTRSPEDMWGFDMLVHGVRGDPIDQFAMSDEELEVFGVDWEGLRDDDLLRSLRQNYVHEQGSNTWLGRHGPPERLNEVEVLPPSVVANLSGRYDYFKGV